MTQRERFLAVLRFEMPDDRLPMLEWGAFWDETLSRWQHEGLPQGASTEETLTSLGMDCFLTLPASASQGLPPPTFYGGPVADTAEAYEALKQQGLFSDAAVQAVLEQAQALRQSHQNGNLILHLWLDGFFWFPRAVMGIEGHLYGFYDNADLMHQINRDLLAFNLRAFNALLPVMEPDVVIFAEDISYNHGPMISKALFQEFITPYYQALLPEIKKHGVKVLMDSDGDITAMVPWLLEAGIEGVGPLERQAGVDVEKIRKAYPDFLMWGGYDKMVMPHGEAAMRAEFERLLPTMRSGGYIPTVDHQTPPGVSLEQYRCYVRLLQEYTEKATKTP